MAFAQGDAVIVSSELSLEGHPAPPLIGTVESTGPTIVNWEDGSRSQYADDSYLYKIAPAADQSPLGQWLQGKINNYGGRFSGPCVGVYALTNNADVSQGDFVVVRVFDDLYFTVPPASFAVAENR